MNRLLLFLVLSCCVAVEAVAQNEAIVQEGEIGISFGGAHYFGDLNNQSAINNPKPVVGVFFRKQFGHYIALRISGHYAALGYADNLSNVEFQQRRNLSFGNKIWELAIQGDFNFFDFIPGSKYYLFTPYLTFGVGTFSHDPYAFLDGEKYYLRKLATEGQGTAAYPDRKPYSNQAFSFPFGMGVKYNLGRSVNLSFEVTHRFTSTDYLDDVSSTFAGQAVFPKFLDGKPNPAFLLQDRSYETGPRIGTAGWQRGFREQKDQFLFAELAISISFSSYRCANPR